MPTNSPELKEEILEGGTADSNCLELLMEVSPLFIDADSLSRIIFPKRSNNCFVVSPVTQIQFIEISKGKFFNERKI